MPSLGATLKDLLRARQKWEALLAHQAEAGPPPPPKVAVQQRLHAVTGFGPNPGNLCMLAYVPDDLPPGAPLVVVLHGCTQDAAGYDQGSGWSTLADRFGFALLVPEQRKENNPNRCFNWFRPEHVARGKGEVASIRDGIAKVLADHGLDQTRVYVTGLSAGGAMTAAMLAAYPEVFAGGAIIAGLPYGSAATVQEAFDSMFKDRPRPARAWGDLVRAAAPQHRGPWPRVQIWHGGADATVRPSNAEELVKQWTDVHGLRSAPTAQERIGTVRHLTWSGPDGGAPLVESYLIPGMTHGTPIAPGIASEDERCGQAMPYMLDAGISSTYRIAQSWGLTETRRRAARPAAPVIAPGIELGQQRRSSVGRDETPPRSRAARPLTEPAQTTPSKAATAAIDPAALIADALRKARLLGGRRGS